MKYYYISDIHLEWLNKYKVKSILKSFDSLTKEDTIIFNGDICSPKYQLDFLISYLTNKVDHIIYVAGNHEYYGSSIQEIDNYITSLEDKYLNFSFLNNKKIVVNGVEILGGTGWSNILNQRVGSLNDLKTIKNMSPERMTKLHEEFVLFLKTNIDSNKNQVIVSHFLPSSGVITEYHKNSELNFYFCNGVYDKNYELSPKYWLYGHDHSKNQKIKINDTIFLTNQGEYGNMRINLDYFKM